MSVALSETDVKEKEMKVSDNQKNFLNVAA